MKQQEIILRDSLSVYGRALRDPTMTTGVIARTSTNTHMESLFPVSGCCYNAFICRAALVRSMIVFTHMEH